MKNSNTKIRNTGIFIILLLSFSCEFHKSSDINHELSVFQIKTSSNGIYNQNNPYDLIGRDLIDSLDFRLQKYNLVDSAILNYEYNAIEKYFSLNYEIDTFPVGSIEENYYGTLFQIFYNYAADLNIVDFTSATINLENEIISNSLMEENERERILMGISIFKHSFLYHHELILSGRFSSLTNDDTPFNDCIEESLQAIEDANYFQQALFIAQMPWSWLWLVADCTYQVTLMPLLER